MYICRACAELERSCCRRRDILVTAGDLERLTVYTGRPDFFEFRRPASMAYIEQDEDPNWNSYTLSADGRRRVLRHGTGGACYYLTTQGCQLPLTVRPLVCRLHPVEYTEWQITGVATDCPVELLPQGEALLDHLQMETTVVEGWRAQLYEELRRERPAFPKAA